MIFSRNTTYNLYITIALTNDYHDAHYFSFEKPDVSLIVQHLTSAKLNGVRVTIPPKSFSNINAPLCNMSIVHEYSCNANKLVGNDVSIYILKIPYKMKNTQVFQSPTESPIDFLMSSYAGVNMTVFFNEANPVLTDVTKTVLNELLKDSFDTASTHVISDLWLTNYCCESVVKYPLTYANTSSMGDSPRLSLPGSMY